MGDIVPELLEAIEKRYRDGIAGDDKLAAIRRKIEDGNSSCLDADEYAKRTGDILADAYTLITDEVLPGGVMYYNIADRILRPTIMEAQEEVLNIAEQIQNLLNKKAGIGIRAIRPALNQDRITGIIERVVRDEENEKQMAD